MIQVVDDYPCLAAVGHVCLDVVCAGEVEVLCLVGCGV